MTVITTPAGVKVRNGSARRFVVIADEIEPGRTRARIVKRSDDVAAARAERDRRGPVRIFADGSRIVFSVVDTTTGDVVA